jgi:branched-chain amino acid transport system permease protein
MHFALNRTRIGLLIRAGVENREMVEALGFRIDRLFIAVFMAGSALAAMGGAMWAGYQGLITPAIGPEMMILVFIVVIIGGLGSLRGTVVAAVLIGLSDGIISMFFSPTLAKIIATLLVAMVLVFRPQGLFGTASR